MQNILVILIVAMCAGFAALKIGSFFRKQLRSDGPACNTKCAGCACSQSCESESKKA